MNFPFTIKYNSFVGKKYTFPKKAKFSPNIILAKSRQNINHFLDYFKKTFLYLLYFLPKTFIIFIK